MVAAGRTLLKRHAQWSGGGATFMATACPMTVHGKAASVAGRAGPPIMGMRSNARATGSSRESVALAPTTSPAFYFCSSSPAGFTVFTERRRNRLSSNARVFGEAAGTFSGFGVSSSSGSRTMNVLPCPGSLSTAIVPP